MFETFNKKVKAFVVGFGAIPKSYREGINNDDSLYTLGIRLKGKEIINNKLSWLKNFRMCVVSNTCCWWHRFDN